MSPVMVPEHFGRVSTDSLKPIAEGLVSCCEDPDPKVKPLRGTIYAGIRLLSRSFLITPSRCDRLLRSIGAGSRRVCHHVGGVGSRGAKPWKGGCGGA